MIYNDFPIDRVDGKYRNSKVQDMWTTFRVGASVGSSNGYYSESVNIEWLS